MTAYDVYMKVICMARQSQRRLSKYSEAGCLTETRLVMHKHAQLALLYSVFLAGCALSVASYALEQRQVLRLNVPDACYTASVYDDLEV